MLFLRTSGSEHLFKNFTRSTTFFWLGLILLLFNSLFVIGDINRCFDGGDFSGEVLQVQQDGRFRVCLTFKDERRVYTHKNVAYYIKPGDTITRSGNSLFITINENKYLMVNYTALLFLSISLSLMLLGLSRNPSVRDFIYTGEDNVLGLGIFALIIFNMILL